MMLKSKSEQNTRIHTQVYIKKNIQWNNKQTKKHIHTIQNKNYGKNIFHDQKIRKKSCCENGDWEKRDTCTCTCACTGPYGVYKYIWHNVVTFPFSLLNFYFSSWESKMADSMFLFSFNSTSNIFLFQHRTKYNNNNTYKTKPHKHTNTQKYNTIHLKEC